MFRVTVAENRNMDNECLVAKLMWLFPMTWTLQIQKVFDLAENVRTAENIFFMQKFCMKSGEHSYIHYQIQYRQNQET